MAVIEQDEVHDDALEQRRIRPVFAVGGIYVVVRLLLIAGLSPTVAPDTGGYDELSLLGNATRPWLVPGLLTVTTDWSFVIIQTVVSAVAFCVLAVAIGSTIEDHATRIGVMGVVLLLGLTPRITSWDAVILSEALAVSLTAFGIAVAVWFRRLPSWTIAAWFVAWVFVRDAHLWIGVPVAAALAWGALRHRRRLLAGMVILTAVWGVAVNQGDDWAERYNVTANVAHRIIWEDDGFQWLTDNGMPSADPFLGFPSALALQEMLLDDAAFQAWAADDGPAVIARYVATHPAYAAEGVITLVADDTVIGEAMFDETFAPYSEPNGRWLGVVWPSEGSVYSVVLVLAALGGVLVASRLGRLDRRWIIPGVLLGSTVPHAMFVYHAAPIEIARHALVLAFVFVVSAWWMIGLTVDVARQAVKMANPSVPGVMT